MAKPRISDPSQYPIEESEFRRFESRGGHERYVGKGMLRTRVSLGPDGQKLDIYNVHLVSPPEKLTLLGAQRFLTPFCVTPHLSKFE